MIWVFLRDCHDFCSSGLRSGCYYSRLFGLVENNTDMGVCEFVEDLHRTPIPFRKIVWITRETSMSTMSRSSTPRSPLKIHQRFARFTAPAATGCSFIPLNKRYKVFGNSQVVLLSTINHLVLDFSRYSHGECSRGPFFGALRWPTCLRMDYFRVFRHV